LEGEQSAEKLDPQKPKKKINIGASYPFWLCETMWFLSLVLEVDPDRNATKRNVRKRKC